MDATLFDNLHRKKKKNSRDCQVCTTWRLAHCVAMRFIMSHDDQQWNSTSR